MAHVSCNKDDVPELPAADNILRIVHVHAGAPLEFNELKYLSPDSLMYSVQTLRYFLSDIRLEDCCGKKQPLVEKLYIDAGTAYNTLQQFPLSEEPEAYSMLCFTLGLSDTVNAHGLFTTLPEIAMEWPMPMGGGYHYMKLEGKYLHHDTIHNYHIHTGMLNGVSRHINYCFALHHEVSLGGFDISLVMDAAQWLDHPHPFSLPDIAGGMMANDEAQQLIYENGATVFSLLQP